MRSSPTKERNKQMSVTREKVVALRCTAKEYIVIEQAAESQCLTISAFVRSVVLRKAAILHKKAAIRNKKRKREKHERPTDTGATPPTSRTGEPDLT